jgi:hypothetical protein
MVGSRVSPRTGRNDPCPCGSGKKYKRCCLPQHEAAARDAAARALLWNAAGMSEFESEGEEERLDVDWASGLVDAEPDRLDVRQIKSVRYVRGLVADPADLRSAIDLRTSHWVAPDIPTAILDSIDRERLDELEGEWGEPCRRH